MDPWTFVHCLDVPQVARSCWLRFECFPIAWKPKLFVTRHTFAPRALCQCRPGRSGSGSNCRKCPLNTYANEPNLTKCVDCPEGAQTDEDGRYSIDYCKCPLDQVIRPKTDSGSFSDAKCECKKKLSFSKASADSVTKTQGT